MGFAAPPSTLDGTPAVTMLPEGTVLRRVHPETTRPDGFDNPRTNVFGGAGRFDATVRSGYRTMCASATPEAAVAERFLREYAVTPGTQRYLVRRSLAGQVFSELRTVMDLALIKLTSVRDLAAIHQDAWLVSCRADDFPATREWATWLHDEVPWAQGILWQSDLTSATVVLFSDRTRTSPVAELAGRRRFLDAPENTRWLTDMLAPYGVRTHLATPPSPRFFLNHRQGDCDAAALLVHNELSRRLGEQQVSRTGPDLRGCRTMLVLVGRDWERPVDPSVGSRIVEARVRGASVIPVLVGDRPRLRVGQLPDPLRFLVGAQFLHLPIGFDETDVELLVDRVLVQANDN